MTEQAVIMGIGFTAAMFGYYAFKLRESSIESNQRVAVFLAFISLLFTNMLFYATYLVAINNHPAIFGGGLLESGLLLMVWTTNILLFYMLAAGIYQLVRWIIKEAPRAFKSAKE